MKRIAKQIFLLVLLVAPSIAYEPALADWYFGVTGGKTNNEWVPTYNPSAGESIDDTSNYLKPFVGQTLSTHFAWELGYADLNRIVSVIAPGQSTEVEARSLAFTLVGRVPVHSKVDFFGRWGLGYWDTKLTVDGAGGKKKGMGQVVGLGFDFKITNRWSLGFEWEQYQNVGEGTSVPTSKLTGQNVDVLGIRLIYRLDLAPGP